MVDPFVRTVDVLDSEGKRRPIDERYSKLVSVIAVLAVLATAGAVLMIRQHQTNATPSNPAKYVTSLPKIGNPVPEFALPRYPDRKTISLSDYKGKPMFINFWASW